MSRRRQICGTGTTELAILPFLWPQQESPMGLARRRFRRPLPWRGRILRLYGIYWPWGFEDAVCTQRSAESHRVGQDSFQADLASDRYGHVWRSDTPWSGEQPDKRVRLQEFATMVSRAQKASLKTRWDLLPLAS